MKRGTGLVGITAIKAFFNHSTCGQPQKTTEAESIGNKRYRYGLSQKNRKKM